MKEYRYKFTHAWQIISKSIKEFKVILLGYRSYTALLTQDGTNPPTAQVLENTLGGEVTYIYQSVGAYQAVLPINYTANKLWVSITNNSNALDSVWNYYGCFPNDATCNTVDLRQYNGTGVGFWTPANGAFNASIEIRIYN